MAEAAKIRLRRSESHRRPGELAVPVGQIELSDHGPIPRGNRAGKVHALVTLHGVPLGTITETPGRDPHDIRSALIERFSDHISTHLHADGQAVDLPLDDGRLSAVGCAFSAPQNTQLISVVISTLGTEPRLAEAIASVLAQSHRNLELIVVDNDPSLGSERLGLDELHDPRLRILQQPIRGLSAGRNLGLAGACGDIVAFLDDDAVADVDWIRQLIAPFNEHESVTCVTGLVLPAQIETPAQALFEEFGAFDKGFERVVWSLREAPVDDLRGTRGERDALFPYSAGIFGSGNNMAFRRDLLIELGGFDRSLGAGTLTRGGEDLDAFLRVILQGTTLVYDPTALVRHYARRSMSELKRQVFGYGSGMGAVIMKQLLAGPRSAWAVVSRIPRGVRRLIDPRSTKNDRKSDAYPVGLSLIELAGYLASPLLYIRARSHMRRLTR